jgi:ABC-type branched-subunit amino acid transport system ATPase component
MDLISINGFTLSGLEKINVILGKNGCGKSFLQKQIEQGIQGKSGFGKVRYISPERGGLLKYEPGIEQNIAQNPNWIEGQRRRNQSSNFREQSATLFRRLELLVLREIEREHTKDGYVPRGFGQTIDKLNVLLDRVRIERDEAAAFRIFDKQSDGLASPESLSSGEAELISLGIEFLAFVKECVANADNVLLVDEPDVHLHPDLQSRLANFIVDVTKDCQITLILATHSTAFLSSLAQGAETKVAFMRRGDTTLNFKRVSDVDKAILPIFGAHPLSNVFNEAPILLVEGEDDERIWQQAMRSSGGKIRVFPCAVGGLPSFSEFESETNNIIESVYDNARAYSLRDRDLEPEAISNVGHIVRMRLACRAAENLMLANQTLAIAGSNWQEFQERASQWVKANSAHPYHAEVEAFVQGKFNRKDYDLKNIRNILVGLVSNKPWEVLVGQAIGQLAQSRREIISDGSLRSYLGEAVCQKILKLPRSMFAR